LYSREVPRSFLVFCLLFRQEACEGDDVSVDPLCAGTSKGFAIRAIAVSSHGGFCKLMLNSKEQWARESRKTSRARTSVEGKTVGGWESGFLI
jgi:hypothetical protein